METRNRDDYTESALRVMDLNGFEAMFRLTMLRIIVSHRGINVKSIAEVLGVQEKYVTQILNGTKAHADRDYNALIDRIDDAVSVITKRRGDMCYCSDAELLKLRDTLKEGL